MLCLLRFRLLLGGRQEGGEAEVGRGGVRGRRGGGVGTASEIEAEQVRAGIVHALARHEKPGRRSRDEGGVIGLEICPVLQHHREANRRGFILVHDTTKLTVVGGFASLVSFVMDSVFAFVGYELRGEGSAAGD